MKTLFKMTSFASLMAATMMAQGPRPFGVMTSATPPDPATIVQNQVARLTALINLTTAQAAQATTIFTNALAAVTPLQTTLNTDRQSLESAVTSNAISSIDQLSTSIGMLTGQIIAIQNKADAAFYAILTSAQQTTLTQNGGFGRLGGFGPGPGAGPGRR
jgi:hypothetical protein